MFCFSVLLFACLIVFVVFSICSVGKRPLCLNSAIICSWRLSSELCFCFIVFVVVVVCLFVCLILFYVF